MLIIVPTEVLDLIHVWLLPMMTFKNHPRKKGSEEVVETSFVEVFMALKKLLRQLAWNLALEVANSHSILDV